MHWSWNDSWSGWNWALMMIGMVAFWGLAAWAIASLVRSPNQPRSRCSDSAEEILAGGLRQVRSKSMSINIAWMFYGRARLQPASNLRMVSFQTN